MLEHPSSGWPAAVAAVQPVSASATAFMMVTRPSASVVMTASPMLASVVRSRSLCSAMVWAAASRAVRCRASSTMKASTPASDATPDNNPVASAER